VPEKVAVTVTGKRNHGACYVVGTLADGREVRFRVHFQALSRYRKGETYEVPSSWF
jgi:hypothetical protein